MYSLTDFDFNLPAELIAQSPLAERTQSRLLHVQPDRLIDGLFTDVLATLEAGDVLVFNDTRVVNARFFGVKETGGRVEVLVTTHYKMAFNALRVAHLPLRQNSARLGRALFASVSKADAASPPGTRWLHCS
jgi:S-adenosylmethionine:tRNA-ribosyltransferase-isomerase (queuine synthetase)